MNESPEEEKSKAISRIIIVAIIAAFAIANCAGWTGNEGATPIPCNHRYC